MCCLRQRWAENVKVMEWDAARKKKKDDYKAGCQAIVEKVKRKKTIRQQKLKILERNKEKARKMREGKAMAVEDKFGVRERLAHVGGAPFEQHMSMYNRVGMVCADSINLWVRGGHNFD